ncbi:hypothetical protein KC356_g7589 [Hortaea werneckii]|nr:hypothetical protein KC356_g7589 [Hortaea werneckii]
MSTPTKGNPASRGTPGDAERRLEIRSPKTATSSPTAQQNELLRQRVEELARDLRQAKLKAHDICDALHGAAVQTLFPFTTDIGNGDGSRNGNGSGSGNGNDIFVSPSPTRSKAVRGDRFPGHNRSQDLNFGGPSAYSSATPFTQPARQLE